jgi:hypothetical protein
MLKAASGLKYGFLDKFYLVASEAPSELIMVLSKFLNVLEVGYAKISSLR